MFGTDNFLDAELRYRAARVRQDWSGHAEAGPERRWVPKRALSRRRTR